MWVPIGTKSEDKAAFMVNPGDVGEVILVQEISKGDLQVEAFNMYRLHFQGHSIPGYSTTCDVEKI